jgi:hypothetical protein
VIGGALVIGLAAAGISAAVINNRSYKVTKIQKDPGSNKILIEYEPYATIHTIDRFVLYNTGCKTEESPTPSVTSIGSATPPPLKGIEEQSLNPSKILTNTSFEYVIGQGYSVLDDCAVTDKTYIKFTTKFESQFSGSASDALNSIAKTGKDVVNTGADVAKTAGGAATNVTGNLFGNLLSSLKAIPSIGIYVGVAVVVLILLFMILRR